MAITSGYFNSVNGDRKYNADQMSEYFEGIINEGVCQHIDGGLAVTAGTGLSVNVAAGKAFIGKKWIRNDASLTLTISAASASYARIDAVVLRRNNTTRTCQIVVKSGTPAASPSAPTMTRNSTTYEMALAYVNVAANATSVTVTDKRADTTVCGWATVAESVPGEIDAQLNAMKTGFDGVVYDSPAAMVQGEDQKISTKVSQIGFTDLIGTVTTNEKSFTTSSAHYINYANDLTFTQGTKLLISVKISPQTSSNYYIGILKADLRGWVASSLVGGAVTGNSSKVFNKVYTLPQDGKIAFRTASNSDVSGTVELYVYDVSNIDISTDNIGSDFYDVGGYAKFALKAITAEGSNDSNYLNLIKMSKSVHISASASVNFKPLDFYTWTAGHTYLFVISDDTGLVADGKVIGWLNTSSSWARRDLWTKKLGDGGYVVCVPPETANPSQTPQIVFDSSSTQVNCDVTIYDVTGLNLTESDYDLIFYNGEQMNAFDIINYSVQHFDPTDRLLNKWYGKNVLFIGDSLSEANKYQLTVKENLGINYTNHAKGGYGIINIINGYDTFPALSVADVTDKDLIVFYAGYNDRGTLVGEVGDLYPTQNTIAGRMQYAVNKIYELLATAENLTCKLLIVTLDCAGKYPWIDADGYTEYPTGSGQTMETIANMQKELAAANSIACVDLWHDSGINRNTWTVFGRQPDAYIDDPTEPSAPYPHNGDQLHKSDAGYKRIGECITGAIIKAYGN